MSSTSQNLSYATQNQSSTTQNMSSITTTSTSVQKSETFSSSSSSLETSQQFSSQVSGPLERNKYFYKADFFATLIDIMFFTLVYLGSVMRSTLPRPGRGTAAARRTRW